MFISIVENRSGQEWIRRLAPNESLCVRFHVEQWAERNLDGYGFNLSFSEPGSHIHNGCADYQAEIAPSGRIVRKYAANDLPSYGKEA